MGLDIQPTPVGPDKGTGTVTLPEEPTTHTADDVTNESTGEATSDAATTYKADALEAGSTGDEDDDAPPVTMAADWPPHGEDKAVTDGEAKAVPATKAPAAKKGN